MFAIPASNFVFHIHDLGNVGPSFDFTVFFEIFEDLVLIFSPIFPFHWFSLQIIIIIFQFLSAFQFLKELKLDWITILYYVNIFWWKAWKGKWLKRILRLILAWMKVDVSEKLNFRLNLLITSKSKTKKEKIRAI